MLMFGGFFPVGIWGLSLGVMGFFECIRLLFASGGRVFLLGLFLFQCFLLESLILAQDERWRRA